MNNNFSHINSLSLTSKMPVNLRFTDISNIHIKNSNMNTSTKVHENLSLDNLPNEIWKDIPDYEGFYQISNLGRVKSLERISIQNHLIKNRILRQVIGGTGYYNVGLHKDGKYKTSNIHQLIAIVFLNYKPNRYKIAVNHIDINRLNNDISNLEIVTVRKNSNQKHLKSTSKYIGVSWDKQRKKWASNIYINGKQKRLGIFTVENEAHLAYQKELKTLNRIK